MMNFATKFKRQENAIWVNTPEKDHYSFEIGKLYHNPGGYNFFKREWTWFSFIDRRKVAVVYNGKLEIIKPIDFFGAFSTTVALSTIKLV